MREKEHARKRSVRKVGKHARGGQQERKRQHEKKRETVKHKRKNKHAREGKMTVRGKMGGVRKSAGESTREANHMTCRSTQQRGVQ